MYPGVHDLSELFERREALMAHLSHLLRESETDPESYLFDIMRHETIISQVNEMIEIRLFGGPGNNLALNAEADLWVAKQLESRPEGIKNNPRLPEV